MPELVCNRCKSALRAESACALYIEVRIAGRLVERLQFFDLHPACARLAAEPELNKRRTKYRRRPGAEIRHELVQNVT